jgi:putative addiction module killer protein
VVRARSLSSKLSHDVFTINLVEAQPREIRNYLTAEGRSPFQEWLDSVRDMKARVRIEKRLERVALGNLGDYRSVGQGVYELKIDYGPGYRVYFGQIGSILVLLLCGGDKSTQEQDILRAKEYWRDYERSENSKK